MSPIGQIFTIGHSTRTADELQRLLRQARVELVCDVRRFPSSRRHPHFNAPELERTLGEAGIAYEHMPALGGRRSPLPGSPNGGWRVGQFQGYADHMASDEFEAALRRLIALGGERRCAVMCAEAQWTRCHRRLLSDALQVRGFEVVHLGARGRAEPHELTPFALIEDGRLSYPPAQAELRPSGVSSSEARSSSIDQ